MDKFEKAQTGYTTYFTYDELFVDGRGFLTEADLTNWCDTYELTFSYNPSTQLYKIYKP